MKLFFLTFVILLISCSPHFKTQRTIALININDFRAVTLTKDTTNAIPQKGSKTVVVFANNNACNACFGYVGNYLQPFLSDSGIQVVAFCRVGTHSLSRRSLINSFAYLMPQVKSFYFDIQDTSSLLIPKEGLFATLNIKYTPALLIWDNQLRKTELFLPYSELIQKPDGSVKPAAKKKIAKILHE